MQYTCWLYVVSFGSAPVSKFGITRNVARRVKGLTRSPGVTKAALEAGQWMAECSTERGAFHPKLRLDYAIGYRKRASARRVETQVNRRTRRYELFNKSLTEWRRLPPHEMIAQVNRAVGETSLHPYTVWTYGRPSARVKGFSVML